MIATGSYVAKAVEPLVFSKSPKQGTPGVEVTFELNAGPNKGERIKWVGWLTPKTEVRTSESLALMGYDGKNESSVMTNEVVLVIEHETYQNEAGEDRTRARVAWVNDKSGGGRMDPMTTTEIAGAKERLKAALAAQKAKAAKPTNPEDEPRF